MRTHSVASVTADCVTSRGCSTPSSRISLTCTRVTQLRTDALGVCKSHLRLTLPPLLMRQSICESRELMPAAESREWGVLCLS